jgi:hypothetical protein
LVLYKIIPGVGQIILEHRSSARFGALVGLGVILVDHVYCPEIAEMPIEQSLVGQDMLGDGRHYDIAAVARIAGDRKSPDALLGGGERS